VPAIGQIIEFDDRENSRNRRVAMLRERLHSLGIAVPFAA
jgi:hypothetical protein